MDEQTRRRFERWQLESLAGGETAKAGLFGKTLGLLGLDADGNRAATSWTDAAKHTAGNLINAPQDIGNQLLDLQDYQPVYGTGASDPEDRARAGQQAVSTFGLAGLAPVGGVVAGKMASHAAPPVERPPMAPPSLVPPSAPPSSLPGGLLAKDGASATKTAAYESYLKHLFSTELTPRPLSFSEFNTLLAQSGLRTQKIAGRDRWIGVDAPAPVAEAGQHSPLRNAGTVTRDMMPPPGQDPVPGVRRLDGSALYANSKEGALPGLAMDHASRMERAKQMDINTGVTLYHGTPNDVRSFSLDKSGANTATQSSDPAVWMTTEPKNAQGYAEGWGATPREGANIMPLHAKTNNLDVWELGGGNLTPELQREAFEQAKKDNRDGVLFRNALDPSRPMAAGGAASRNAPHVVAMFDPAHIRSKFAAFDPTKRDSSNILASNAREAAPLGMTSQSEQNDPYRTALQMQARRKALGLPY